MNFVLKADQLLSKSNSKIEKIIKLYQYALSYLNEEEKLEVYQKLLHCYQLICCNYDIANCWYHIANLSKKLDYPETEFVYKIAIQFYYPINNLLTGNILIELGEYYEEKNKIKDACECYQQVADIHFNSNCYAFYFYTLKKADLLSFHHFYEDAIYTFHKLYTYCCQEKEIQHYSNFVFLKLIICKTIQDEDFVLDDEFKKTKEYQIFINKKPIDDWFKEMFLTIDNKNGRKSD